MQSANAGGGDRPAPPEEERGHAITFGEALAVWIKIALNSFGGPAGQIAVMHRVLVEEKRWISEDRFLHALNYCMLLPGPEAQQLATYIGWLLHRTTGGLVAGTLFILPGFLSILLLSVLYAGYQELTLVQGTFFGIKAAVLAVVVEAVLRIGRRALKNRVMGAIAAGAFVAIFFFDLPFPLIVLGAGLVGWLGGRVREDSFLVIKGHAVDEQTLLAEHWQHTSPSVKRFAIVTVICLTLWWAPLLVLAVAAPGHPVFLQEGLFFSKAAVVTFGGAYSVLAYIAQAAVADFGWLLPGEMLDGLGMAETTPGPLIQVVQFVGFMGAYRNPGALDPMLAGALASLLTTWVTFVPCFLWIFLGAPYIETLRDNRAISTTLSAITAAVVGVILNLAVWFALHTLFGEVRVLHHLGAQLQLPVWGTVNGPAVLLAGAALVAVLRFRVGMIPTLAASAVAGVLFQVATG